MKLPRYAEYKESGVGWIGRIPSHWTCTKLKHLLAGLGSVGHRTRTMPASGRRRARKEFRGSRSEICQAERMYAKQPSVSLRQASTAKD
jgi:hypothetical protein